MAFSGGKITPSLFHGSQELTFALANLNFDFSLVKVEAPEAYHGLGTALSMQRKGIAESGTPHITARKLGALFEEILPSTPKLHEAYGRRVSEIATVEESLGKKEPAGFFSSYTGLDGTTIWAAATSSTAAVSVHLLACMLAKMFPPAEAISIWVELVEARKKQIASLTGQSNNTTTLSLFLAGQCVISRDQLAEWDNSARAWLRRAEQVKKKQQTQLLLICSNINLPVNARPSTYENVIEGWKTALVGMECLLNSQSQHVTDGGLLLALSSWHMYPDILAHGDTLVKQHDEIFPPGAQIVLGLEGSPSTTNSGIYWCLPLAHLRFYGDPEVSDRAVHVDTSRLTPLQLSCVALGSMLSTWGSEGRDVMKASRIITTIFSLIYGDWSNEANRIPSRKWFLVLVDASSALLKAQGVERELLLKLVTLGRSKKAQDFLGPKSRHPPPLFGLTIVDNIIFAFKDVEDSISLLRYLAMQCLNSAPTAHVIIQYSKENAQRPATTKTHGKSSSFEYATGLPHHDDWNSTHRNSRRTGNPAWKYYRWGRETTDGNTQESKTFCRNGYQEVSAQPSPEMGSINPKSLYWTFEELNPFPRALGDEDLPVSPHLQAPVIDDIPATVSSSDNHVDVVSSGPSIVLENETEDIKLLYDEIARKDIEKLRYNKLGTSFRFFAGDKDSAALFVHLSECNPYLSDQHLHGIRPQHVPLDTLDTALRLGLLDAQKVRVLIEAAVYRAPSLGYEDFAVSLAALGLVSSAYAHLSDALISPSVVARPICSAKWLGRNQGNNYKAISGQGSKMSLTREEMFSCLAYMDYGLDIELSAFKNVMAISCGDSIYVASALLCDPLKKDPPQPVRRIIGNVGKPGLALLVPPANPRCSANKAEDWRLIGCEPYQGQPADNFTGTSLSLSFTDWRIPVDLGSSERGRQDVEAYTYETLISVFEKGKWIADLDVLDAVSKGSFDRKSEWYYQVGCEHKEEKEAVSDLDTDEVITINSWEEFLDHPTGPAIVMAHQNWAARLAAASLAVRRRDRVFVAEKFCQQCLTFARRSGGENFVGKAIFIC